MALRAIGAIMALCFIFSVAVQFNDPDPLSWITFYGAAAVVSGWSAFSPRLVLWPLPAAVGIVALGWALTIAPRVWGQVPLSELFREFEMRSAPVEETREALGLVIVAVWMAVLAIAHARRGAHSRRVATRT